MPESTAAANWRILNKDGTLNLDSAHLNRAKMPHYYDLYHSLLAISWPRFFLVLLVGYLLANLAFAALYLFIRPESIEAVGTATLWDRLCDNFFFSIQPIVGEKYSHQVPFGVLTDFVITFEFFIGMVCLAMIAGLSYARFAAPVARVLYSHNALITTHEGRPAFIFRAANARLNQIVEARVGVTFVRNEKTKEGQSFRRLYDLKLHRAHSPVFALTWTIIHYIDEHSPLYGLSSKDLEDLQVEVVVILAGTDETMAQTVHSRNSYIAGEVLFNRQFKDMLSRNPQGQIQIDLKAIDDIQ